MKISLRKKIFYIYLLTTASTRLILYILRRHKRRLYNTQHTHQDASYDDVHVMPREAANVSDEDRARQWESIQLLNSTSALAVTERALTLLRSLVDWLWFLHMLTSEISILFCDDHTVLSFILIWVSNLLKRLVGPRPAYYFLLAALKWDQLWLDEIVQSGPIVSSMRELALLAAKSGSQAQFNKWSQLASKYSYESRKKAVTDRIMKARDWLKASTDTHSQSKSVEQRTRSWISRISNVVFIR